MHVVFGAIHQDDPELVAGEPTDRVAISDFGTIRWAAAAKTWSPTSKP